MSVYPVPIFKGMIPTLSQGFGGGSGKHEGVDVMYRKEERGTQNLPEYSPWYYMPTGVPALAYDDGVVTRSSIIGTGGRVEIDHGDGLKTKYYHLQGTPSVKVGQGVKAGQIVGYIYHNVSGYRLNHLHFEVIKNGRHVDPAPYLKNAQKIEAPNMVGFLGKVGASIVAGLLAFKYIFK
jgi:hypothetical protein